MTGNLDYKGADEIRASSGVTLVTVTYGRRWHLLKRVIASALEQGVTKAIVVDNGSLDDVPDLTRATFGDQVHVVSMGLNRGSAPAFRAGIARAVEEQTRFVLILDDDNVLGEGSLDLLLFEHARFTSTNPSRPHITLGFRPDNMRDIAAGAKRRILTANSFLGFDLIEIPQRVAHRLLPRRGAAEPKKIAPIAVVDVAPYGGMLFDKRLIERIGLPNADFVLYADDTEFSYRVTKQGGQLSVITGALVLDIEQSWNLKNTSSGIKHWLTGGTSISTYYAMRNRIYFETHHVRHSRVYRAVNRFLFRCALKLAARRFDSAARLELLLSAIEDGERARLGVKDGLELI